MSRIRQRAARLIATAVVTAAGLVLVPVASDAGTARPQREGPVTHRSDTGRGGVIDVSVDALKAEGPDVVGALDDLDGNVREQLAKLEEARDDLAEARSQADEAEQRVHETEERIDELTVVTDELVIDAFVNPPTADVIDALSANSIAEATVKQSILDRQATSNAEALEQLATAEAALDERRAAEEDAAATSESRAADAELRLTDLEGAQSQQAAFVTQVEARLDRQLSEAEALARVDPETAEQMKARELEIADRLQDILTAEEQRKAAEALKLAEDEARREAAERAAAEAARAPATLGPATGGLTTVSCPNGGSITVDSSLGGNLQSLLNAAAADGVQLCGGGFRDPQQQINLRRAHCGSSNYAIYQAPSSSCSPPTARPGQSNHERGLAIDFTCNGGSMGGRGSTCFQWLSANAARFGLRNLPSEPWHWSVDGS